jgi:hypothetical protein
MTVSEEMKEAILSQGVTIHHSIGALTIAGDVATDEHNRRLKEFVEGRDTTPDNQAYIMALAEFILSAGNALQTVAEQLGHDGPVFEEVDYFPESGE